MRSYFSYPSSCRKRNKTVTKLIQFARTVAKLPSCSLACRSILESASRIMLSLAWHTHMAGTMRAAGAYGPGRTALSEPRVQASRGCLAPAEHVGYARERDDLTFSSSDSSLSDCPAFALQSCSGDCPDSVEERRMFQRRASESASCLSVGHEPAGPKGRCPMSSDDLPTGDGLGPSGVIGTL
jgi:hypothetical protein